MIKEIIKGYKDIFGEEGENIFFSPGRVNLIGEHTDYNGGYVFPCALDFGTYGVAKKRNDKKCRLYSHNFSDEGIIEFNIDSLIYDEKDKWANYPKGVIKTFLDNNFNIDTGFDLYVYGNIPNGSGLSSSASLELLIGIILKSYFNLNINMIDIVKLSQFAENNFIGVKCGIMDQFAIGMGKKNNAILLDCNTLNYEYAPVKLDGSSIIIVNTNKKRGLADSKYNERRATCEECVKIFNDNGINIKHLGELTVEKFEKVKKYLLNEEQIKRARHAVSENERTKIAVKFLKKGNIEKFGELMKESHISLRDDYEVTGKELDALFDIACSIEGVIGTRMTGAGFGGCSVNIVKDDSINNFINKISINYKKITGLEPSFYIAKIGDGSHKIGDVHEYI